VPIYFRSACTIRARSHTHTHITNSRKLSHTWAALLFFSVGGGPLGTEGLVKVSHCTNCRANKLTAIKTTRQFARYSSSATDVIILAVSAMLQHAVQHQHYNAAPFHVPPPYTPPPTHAPTHLRTHPQPRRRWVHSTAFLDCASGLSSGAAQWHS